MKKGIAVSHVLSWINLVIGAIFTLFSLFGIVAFPITAVLFLIFLMGAIVLHSYAAIQLRKSLVNPTVPLSKQTPVGIRMMGYMVMLVGFLFFTDSISMLQNAKEYVKLVKIPPQVTQADFIKIMHGAGVFLLLFSFSLVLNVIMNFRFLRWYQLNQANQSQE